VYTVNCYAIMKGMRGKIPFCKQIWSHNFRVTSYYLFLIIRMALKHCYECMPYRYYIFRYRADFRRRMVLYQEYSDNRWIATTSYHLISFSVSPWNTLSILGRGGQPLQVNFIINVTENDTLSDTTRYIL